MHMLKGQPARVAGIRQCHFSVVGQRSVDYLDEGAANVGPCSSGQAAGVRVVFLN